MSRIYTKLAMNGLLRSIEGYNGGDAGLGSSKKNYGVIQYRKNSESEKLVGAVYLPSHHSCFSVTQ